MDCSFTSLNVILLHLILKNVQEYGEIYRKKNFIKILECKFLNLSIQILVEYTLTTIS